MKNFIRTISVENSIRVLSRISLVLFLLAFIGVSESFSQTYANATSNRQGTYGCGGFLESPCGTISGVTSANDARDGSLSDATKATLISNKTILGAIGGDVFITLRFANPVVGKTVYVKIDAPTQIGFLSSVLGFVGLEGTNIVGQLLTGATATTDGSNAATGSTKIITDVTGTNYYLAITPSTITTSFNAVRVNVIAPAIDVASRVTLNVYGAFHYEDTDINCGLPIYSSFGEQTGLSVSLFDAIGNPQRAIDGNIGTASVLGSGLANVGLFSTLSQTIFFKTVSAETDQAVINLSTNTQVLDVNLFSGLSVQAFNGSVAAGTPQLLSNLIDIELLGFDLIGGIPNNTIIPFYYTPTAPFDRVVITLSSTVNAALFSGGINIHEVAQVGQKPTITSSLVYQFGTATPTVNATTTSGDPIFWQGPLPARTNLTANAVSSAAPFPVAVSANNDYVAVSVKGATCTTNFSDATRLRVIVLADGSSTPSGNVDSPYTGSIVATSAGHTFTYSLTGILPSGIGFVPATGALSGTPATGTEGTYPVVVSIFENGVPTGLTLSKSLLIESSLPVTLKRFDVKNEGQMAQLSWATTEEVNSDFFEVQHSADGKNWVELTQVKSYGDSKNLNNYSYTHTSPAAGVNYYRLKMVDRDATFTFSRIRSANFEGADRISIYPNPVSDVLFVQNVNSETVKELAIINNQGVDVYKSATISADGINVANLSAGLYVVKVVQKDGKISSYRVMINR